jgi:hypothetical protein
MTCTVCFKYGCFLSEKHKLVSCDQNCLRKKLFLSTLWSEISVETCAIDVCMPSFANVSKMKL